MMNSIYGESLSWEFCEKWKYLLKELYDYKFEGEFAVVKSVLHRKTLSYLPLTNYTNVNSAQANELIADMPSDGNYQIRLLDPGYKDFQFLDTVTMRLSLEKEHINNIWEEVLDQKCRNQIRQAKRKKLVIKKGFSDKLIDDFYALYMNTMHYHGTPALRKDFFDLLKTISNAIYYVVYEEMKAISAIVLMYDYELAMIGWGASDRSYFSLRPNNFIYWEAIKDAFEAGKKIFDFGRSGFKGGTYSFKRHFGAIPVKIDILRPKPENIYEKYNVASAVWKKLPKKISAYAGPRLCKYLTDL